MDVKPRRLSNDERAFVLDSADIWASGLPDNPAVASLRRSLFKKLRDRTSDPNLSQSARASFLRTEEVCSQTNGRVNRGRHGNKSYADSQVLYLASRKIASILGPFKIEEMIAKGRFGPGATYLCRGTDVSRARKFGLTDVTSEFNKLARGLLAEYPLWASSLTDSEGICCPILEPVPGGRYSTVPKDRSTDRSIIVEPTINSWFQQGIGRMIRSRLKRSVGVDLDDQSTNQRLAQLGSVTNDLATVDLSSASDLISKQLVLDLLPEDWFFWLNATRSHKVDMGSGTWIRLEKFSSMGNGFTFDLQSLIFYCLSWAICVLEGYNTFWVNVFGDDIVVPSGIKERFLAVFRDVGFEVNVSKSYFDGPFRESCGKDFHDGVNVRGVYIKSLETDIDVMKIHNRLFEWTYRTSLPWSELKQTLRLFLVHIRARVPPSLGDLGVYSHFDEVCPPLARESYQTMGWEGYKVTIMKPILLKRDRSDRFLVLDRLQGSEDQGNSVPIRQDICGYRYGTVVSLWEMMS